MEEKKLPEVWLRGPLEDVPGELMPVAHALLQAQEEITEMLIGLDRNLLWQKPFGLASVAFHLQHIVGVLDRLFTYSEGKYLSERQFEYLRNEGRFEEHFTKEILTANLTAAINLFIKKLSTVDAASLYQHRGVGRNQLPSTTIGLLFHCAEHTMRHTGQMLVTVKILQADKVTPDLSH